MTWIKTSEQLPPKDCYVLGYVKKTIEVDEIPCVCENERAFAVVKLADVDADEPFFGTCYDYAADEVLYWTHLPTPPKEDKQ